MRDMFGITTFIHKLILIFTTPAIIDVNLLFLFVHV